MTEQELIELMETRSPEELSVAEIESLRAALPGSPQLQRVLAEHIEMERYLSGTLGRARVSAERIMGAGEPLRDRPESRPTPRRWLVVLVILAGIGAAIAAWAMLGRRPAAHPSVGVAVKTPAVAKPVAAAVKPAAVAVVQPAAPAVVKPAAPSPAPVPVVVAPPAPLVPTALP